MSITSTDDLGAAARKVKLVRDTIQAFASKHMLDVLAEAVCLIETHECPEPPKPAYVFKVGHVLHIQAEVDALPFGTVVRTNTDRTAEKFTYAWSSTSIHQRQGYTVDGSELFGAKIIYLPE